MKKSVKVNSILNAFRVALTVVVPLIAFPYTSRLFEADGTGQINFANSITQVLVLVASLGINTYGIREGTKYRKERDKLSVFAQELFLLNLFSTVVAYIIFFLILFFVKGVQAYRIMLLLHAVNIAFGGVNVEWIYGVEEDYTFMTIRQIVIQVSQIVLLFIFVHQKSDIYIWVLITLICAPATSVANIFFAKKYINLFPLKIKVKSILKHLGPVIVFFAAQLASKAYSYIDSTLLGLESTDYAVGLYSVATKINSILLTCFAAMYPVFLPKIVDSLKINNYQEYYRFSKKIFNLVIAVAMPCVVGLMSLSLPIVRIISGTSFDEAVITVRIIAPILLINSITVGIQNVVFVPKNKERYVFRCTLLSAIINIAISVILIRFFNENGAAIGSIIAESICFIVTFILMIKDDKNNLQMFRGNAYYFIGSIFIGIYCLLLSLVVHRDILLFCLGVIGSVLIYGIWLGLVRDGLFCEFLEIIGNKLKISKIFKR